MLKSSESFKATSNSKSKKIMLTPEIENKLENMSNDLLYKTVVFYENYNYDFSIRNKAQDILHKRGISIEIIVDKNITPVKKSSIIIYLFLIVLLIVGYTYNNYIPSRYLFFLIIILSTIIWLFRYYYIDNEK